MQMEVLQSKIHRATVTGADLDYVGSISISRELCDAAGLQEGRKVLVANIANGNRFETYVMVLDEPGAVVTNGAAAHLAAPGDKVIIMAFALVSEDEAASFRPGIVIVDEDNSISEVRKG